MINPVDNQSHGKNVKIKMHTTEKPVKQNSVCTSGNRVVPLYCIEAPPSGKREVDPKVPAPYPYDIIALVA